MAAERYYVRTRPYPYWCSPCDTWATVLRTVRTLIANGVRADLMYVTKLEDNPYLPATYRQRVAARWQ